MMENKMYKTEMCRNYEEYGMCKYNERCQFAHSMYELRDVERHPRYKTEICKNFVDNKFCKYGKRCCFLHIEDYKGDSDDSCDSQKPYLKRNFKADLVFQGIWDEEKDRGELHRSRISYDLKNKSIIASFPVRLSSKTPLGNSLDGNHALVWTKNPVFYIEEKHKKYYESSAQNMAPGEPVLPVCE